MKDIFIGYIFGVFVGLGLIILSGNATADNAVAVNDFVSESFSVISFMSIEEVEISSDFNI